MNIKEKLEKLYTICSNFNISNIAFQLDIVKKAINNADFIDVGVFGRFKAGKSSFLNSLFSRKVLPVGVIPITAIITKIRYGEKEKATVYYSENAAEEILIEKIHEYVSENYNPKNKKRVVSVEIVLPEMKGYKGLQFIDTPGLGSVFSHNTKMSLDWLPNVGVALAAISTDPPLSKEDVDLIREILKYTPKVKILLTKVDLFNDKEIEEIESYILNSLKAEFSREFDIFRYSSAKNKDFYKNNLDSQLFFPLISRKDEEQKEILDYKISSLINSCEEYLKFAEQSAGKLQTQKEALEGVLTEEKANLSNVVKEFEIQANYYSLNTRVWLNENLKKHKLNLSNKIQCEFELEFPKWKGSVLKVSRLFESWLAHQLSAEINDVSKKENANFNKYIKQTEAYFCNRINSFRLKLSQDIKTTLGIKFKPVEFSAEIKEFVFKDTSLFRTFDFSLDLFWFLLPSFVLKNLLKKHLKNSIDVEIEKNISRLASQWENKIVAVIEETKKRSEEYMSKEIDTVLNIISQKDGKLDKIKSAIKGLELMKRGQ